MKVRKIWLGSGVCDGLTLSTRHVTASMQQGAQSTAHPCHPFSW